MTRVCDSQLKMLIMAVALSSTAGYEPMHGELS